MPVPLDDGDKIRIGDYELRFELPPDAAIVAEEEEDASGDDTTLNDAKKTRLLYSVQTVTVLVVDIRGFTSLTQQISEDLLARTIGTWISESGPILQRYESWSQKYIGDAIMAVWVHNEPQKDQSNLLPALCALHEVAQLTESMQEKLGLPNPLRIGVGIETGWASLGNLGSNATADYTALGDCVNRAFRLESATKSTSSDILLGVRRTPT